MIVHLQHGKCPQSSPVELIENATFLPLEDQNFEEEGGRNRGKKGAVMGPYFQSEHSAYGPQPEVSTASLHSFLNTITSKPSVLPDHPRNCHTSHPSSLGGTQVQLGIRQRRPVPRLGCLTAIGNP